MLAWLPWLLMLVLGCSAYKVAGWMYELDQGDWALLDHGDWALLDHGDLALWLSCVV